MGLLVTSERKWHIIIFENIPALRGTQLKIIWLNPVWRGKERDWEYLNRPIRTLAVFNLHVPPVLYVRINFNPLFSHLIIYLTLIFIESSAYKEIKINLCAISHKNTINYNLFVPHKEHLAYRFIWLFFSRLDSLKKKFA